MAVKATDMPAAGRGAGGGPRADGMLPAAAIAAGWAVTAGGVALGSRPATTSGRRRRHGLRGGGAGSDGAIRRP